MRRPSVAVSPKRNRHRLMKQAVGTQTRRQPRRASTPRLPIERQDAASNGSNAAATQAQNGATAEAGACEPMRCGFGAVRVGALLGRLRLHLHTERFLAVHRGDTLWEGGCVGAALALAIIAAGMQEVELNAALPTSFCAGSSPCGRRPGDRQPSDIRAAGPERGAR